VLARPTLVRLNSLLSAALTTVLQTVFEREHPSIWPGGSLWTWLTGRRMLPLSARRASALAMPPSPTITYSGDVLSADLDPVTRATGPLDEQLELDPGLLASSAADIPPLQTEDPSCILISNHVSTTDFYLIHSVAKRRGMLYACKYFCKDSLKWIPGFGWGMWLVGYIFIRRAWVSDAAHIAATFAHLVRERTPVWLISYPEGTRMTPSKLAESRAFCIKRGVPPFTHVLAPRTKGFVATVQGLRRSHVKCVMDLTLVYQRFVLDVDGNTKVEEWQQAPSMWRVHTHSVHPEYHFHVHIRRWRMDELPEGEEELADWLQARWREKDDMLARLHSAGCLDAAVLGGAPRAVP
jgi:1-acyl-sn-glycerol-3-phosphate acyltransferase